MPALDPTTRSKIEQDYFNETGKTHTSYTEQYSNDPNDQLWGDSSPKLDMGIPLSILSPYFDLENPDIYSEPNEDASTTDYDITNLGGWKVTIGDDPSLIYHVRTADDQYFLRDIESKREKSYYHNNGFQARRMTRPPIHFQ